MYEVKLSLKKKKQKKTPQKTQQLQYKTEGLLLNTQAASLQRSKNTPHTTSVLYMTQNNLIVRLQ